MAFSAETQAAITPVADRLRSMWIGPTPKKFDPTLIISLILTLVQTFCKPKTEESRRSLIRNTAKRCSINGVEGCVECCMSDVRARKTRKKMQKRLGLKSNEQQDQAFFNAVMAANAEQTESITGMTSAFERNETDEEEED